MFHEIPDFLSTTGVLRCLVCPKFVFGWGSSRRFPKPSSQLGRGIPPPHSPSPRRLRLLDLSAFGTSSRISFSESWQPHQYGIVYGESSLDSSDEFRTLSRSLPGVLRPGHQTWAVGSPVGCYCLHPPLPFIVTIAGNSLTLSFG